MAFKSKQEKNILGLKISDVVVTVYKWFLSHWIVLFLLWARLHKAALCKCCAFVNVQSITVIMWDGDQCEVYCDLIDSKELYDLVASSGLTKICKTWTKCYGKSSVLHRLWGRILGNMNRYKEHCIVSQKVNRHWYHIMFFNYIYSKQNSVFSTCFR